MRRPRPRPCSSVYLRALLCLCGMLAVHAASAASPGEEMYNEFLEQGTIMEGPTADYVRRVGARVARAAGVPDGEIVFNVLDQGNVNAFAVVGGYIFIERGLLIRLENEDQLAAVLGHEVGHLTARHSQGRANRARASAVGAFLLAFFTRSNTLARTAQAYSQAELIGYGREQELEADGLGAAYLAEAGYDPMAMFDVIRVLKDDDLFSRDVENRPSTYHGLFTSHPRNDRRLYEVIKSGAATEAVPEIVDHEGDLLEHVDGLAWGDEIAQGVLRGSRYYHGSLGFVVDFPTDWSVTDSRTVLTGVAPHGTRTLVTVELANIPDEDLTPETFITETLGTQIASGREIEVDGMPGYMGMVLQPEPAPEAEADGEAADASSAPEAPPEEREYELRFVAVIFKEGSAFVIRGENRLEDYERTFIEGFSRTVASFRRMRRADLDVAITTRVRVIEASPEDTYETLARRADLGRNGADRLRLLNGDYPRGQPRPGDRVKIVE